MMTETTTRLRNAVALMTAEWLSDGPSPEVLAASRLPFSSMTEADWREAVTLWRQWASPVLSEAPDRPCPACGVDASRFLFFSYDAHPFHECEACGCWFDLKVVDAGLFESYFERCPEARALAGRMMQSRSGDEGREADEARIGAYLDDLQSFRGGAAPGAYLDIGCGVGHSLRAASARGWEVQGVEADRVAVTVARGAGLAVAMPGEPVPPGPYQLITFWETLEHIADPLAALQTYGSMLAEDGLLALTVPNLNALATRTLREECAWVHGGYNTPGHVNLFHVRALERLLARAGLVLLDARGEYSADPMELLGYLHGRTRGAFDTLAGGVPWSMPKALAPLVDGVWPGVALAERVALLSPIVYVVACRAGSVDRFAGAVGARRVAQRDATAAKALALVASEPDYKRLAADLQGEVDRRDALLQTTTRSLQGEVDRRDALLQTTTRSLQGEVDRRDALLQATTQSLQDEVDRRDALLRSTAEALQREINERDQLLAAAHARFERTMDGRVLALWRRLRRFAGA